MSRVSNKPTSIDAVANEVASATAALEEAEREESLMRSRATDARNRLSEAQKALDALLAEMRKTAPLNSHWGYERGTSHRAGPG